VLLQLDIFRPGYNARGITNSQIFPIDIDWSLQKEGVFVFMLRKPYS